MSGGAFDYRQRYIEDIADDIEQEIMKRAVRFPKRYGYVFRSIPTHEEFHTFFVAGSYTAHRTRSPETYPDYHESASNIDLHHTRENRSHRNCSNVRPPQTGLNQ